MELAAARRPAERKAPDTPLSNNTQCINIGYAFSVTWARGYKHTRWSRALGTRTQPAPRLCDIVDTPDTAWLQERQALLNCAKAKWQTVTLVDHNGAPWFHNFIPKYQAARGLFLVANTTRARTKMHFTSERQYVASQKVRLPGLPSLEIQQAVQHNIKSWTCCFTEDETQRIHDNCADIAKDEHFSSVKGRVHRPRRDVHLFQDHVALSIEDYIPIVQLCLVSGFTLRFQQEGRPPLMTHCQTSDEYWGFNASALQSAERTIEWPDHELIEFLMFGAIDYSGDTLPVSWFAPHSSSAYNHWDMFSASVRKEIEKGWIKGPWAVIPTAPFRVVPGAAIPKPRQPSKYRTIWNASVPGPRLGHNVVDNGIGIVLPVETKAAAVLPPYLAMAWMSI